LPEQLCWQAGRKFKKSKFEHYSKMQQNGMSGAEIAEKMLVDNGISDVRVISEWTTDRSLQPG
jgi:Zn-dependent membrane protease YugP